jgi:molybdate transport system substrate-binding protein
MSPSRSVPVVVLAALTALLAGCATPSGAAPSSSEQTGRRVTLMVLAAASLTESFTTIARAFEAEHPGVTVSLSFGGSPALAEQILQGAPADVFAAASPSTMGTVTEGGAAAGTPVVFARNSLEIAVPPGNPGGVRGIADFADPALDLALCAPEVPCGAAAQKVFAAAGITADPDTLEQDVKSVLTKVQLDEVDAGLVYRTDVLAAGTAVEGIEFPEAERAETEYPICVLAGSSQKKLAQQFVDYVRGDGAPVLKDAGFGGP